MERGADCWTSMLRQSLLTQSQVAILEAAERAGNLAWALRLLADRAEKRLEYRVRTVLEFVRPVLTLILGTAIAIVVIGMFLPLVKLLNELS